MDRDAVGWTGNRRSSRHKLGGARRAGGDASRRWSDGLDTRDRHSTSPSGVGSSGRLFPRPSSARAGPSSDGVQRRIDPPRTLVRSAAVGLVLGSPEALEVLTASG